MSSEYQFGKRAPACSGCSREFRPGEEYRSGLILEEPVRVAPGPEAEAGTGGAASAAQVPDAAQAAPPNGGKAKTAAAAAAKPGAGGLPFRRVDICAACWDESRAAGFFSCWKSRVSEEDEAEAKKRPLARSIDSETIYDLFRRLEGHADPGQQKFRFILALMLMRRKRLRFTGVVDSPHGEHLVLDDKDEGISHKVLDPGLSEDEIDSLRGQIDRLLGAGGDPEAVALPAAAGSALPGAEPPVQAPAGAEPAQ